MRQSSNYYSRRMVVYHSVTANGTKLDNDASSLAISLIVPKMSVQDNSC